MNRMDAYVLVELQLAFEVIGGSFKPHSGLADMVFNSCQY